MIRIFVIFMTSYSYSRNETCNCVIKIISQFTHNPGKLGYINAT